jgi:hypothetical protein
MSIHQFLPSEHELVPNLGTLNKLLFERTPESDHKKLHRLIEQLPYYLRGACDAWQRLDALRDAAGQEFMKMPSPGAKWILSPDCADAMAFALDAFLANLRRACDALLLYVNRCPKHVGLRNSLHDVVNRLRNGAYPALAPELKSLMFTYWEEMGDRIKGYRDQGAHFAIGASTCFMFYHPVTRGVGLRMLLPDRHDVKSPSEMKYEPGVPVIGFMIESLSSTLKFINRAVERMIDLEVGGGQDPRGERIFFFAMRGGAPLRSDEDTSTGEPVPFYLSVNDVIRRAVADVLTSSP